MESYVEVTETAVGTDSLSAVKETYAAGKTEGTVQKDQNNQLIWSIGGMVPGEERSLTYRVRLKESYTSGKTKGTLNNEAVAYSRFYPKDNAEASFTPRADLQLKKSGSAYNPSKGTIDYTLVLTANQKNSYISGYKSYSYIFHDTLSAGFTFNDDLKVYMVTNGVETDVTNNG